MRLHRRTHWMVGCLAALAGIAFSRPALAVITGPYTADANTLHLYHFNETAGATTVADAGSAALTMQGVLNSTVLGATSFTGYGSSGDFSALALDTTVPVHRPIVLAAPALAAADGDAVPFSFSETPAAGAGGAFTMEALVKFNSAVFDPTVTNFRNGAAGSVGGTFPMAILMGEGEANGARNFQMKIDQIGTGTMTTANGNTRPRLQFDNLHGIVGNQTFAWDLPITGANAINNTDWFHVAVTYNGLESTAGNLVAYWTKMVSSATTPGSLGAPGSAAVTMNNDLIAANTSFSIGNESRDTGGEGESFPGFIDEVRISSVARAANQFMFSDPAPGDVNGDLVVNILDFNIITANLLKTPAVRAEGDLDGNNIVDFADFRTWKLNKTSPPGDVSIPEPAGFSLAALCLAGCAARARRRAG